MLKTPLQLPEAERQYLQGLVSRSTLSVKTFKRASALLARDGGQSLQQAAAAAGVNYNSVAAWRDRYKAEGLAAAWRDRPRSGRPARIDGTQRARITPPWLAQHAARGARALEPAPARRQAGGTGLGGSHLAPPGGQDSETNALAPHRKKTWCLGELNGRFVALMERLLWLYALPYDPDYPGVCFDERPCFLIGQTLSPLHLHPGQVAREHYAYTKQGSCALWAAIEPKTGQRLAKLLAQRTKREDALFSASLGRALPRHQENPPGAGPPQ